MTATICVEVYCDHCGLVAAYSNDSVLDVRTVLAEKGWTTESYPDDGAVRVEDLCPACSSPARPTAPTSEGGSCEFFLGPDQKVQCDKPPVWDVLVYGEPCLLCDEHADIAEREDAGLGRTLIASKSAPAPAKGDEGGSADALLD